MKVFYPQTCFMIKWMSLYSTYKKNSASTLSKISKTLNAHNFLNIYRKILILDFKNIALIQGIQLKKNFCTST